MISKANYRYDHGREPHRGNHDKGGCETKTIYRYDSTGNKKEMVSYRQDGTVDRKGVYVYDDDNNLIQSLGYLADGRLFSKELYTYDSIGNVIEQINSVSRFTYAYDATAI